MNERKLAARAHRARLTERGRRLARERATTCWWSANELAAMAAWLAVRGPDKYTALTRLVMR